MSFLEIRELAEELLQKVEEAEKAEYAVDKMISDFKSEYPKKLKESTKNLIQNILIDKLGIKLSWDNEQNILRFIEDFVSEETKEIEKLLSLAGA